MLHGRKRWFVAAPEDKPLFNPDETSFYWLQQFLPMVAERTKLLECTLGAGEVGAGARRPCTRVRGLWAARLMTTTNALVPAAGALARRPVVARHPQHWRDGVRVDLCVMRQSPWPYKAWSWRGRLE